MGLTWFQWVVSSCQLDLRIIWSISKEYTSAFSIEKGWAETCALTLWIWSLRESWSFLSCQLVPTSPFLCLKGMNLGPEFHHTVFHLAIFDNFNLSLPVPPLHSNCLWTFDQPRPMNRNLLFQLTHFSCQFHCASELWVSQRIPL